MIRDVVILRDQPDVESFKQFVKELGGDWESSPTVPRYEYGVIGKWGSLVMLDLGQINEPFMAYDEQEMNVLRQYLGREPKKVINIDIRRNKRSISLARKIEEKIVEKWGGYIDRE